MIARSGDWLMGKERGNWERRLMQISLRTYSLFDLVIKSEMIHLRFPVTQTLHFGLFCVVASRLRTAETQCTTQLKASHLSKMFYQIPIRWLDSVFPLYILHGVVYIRFIVAQFSPQTKLRTASRGEGKFTEIFRIILRDFALIWALFVSHLLSLEGLDGPARDNRCVIQQDCDLMREIWRKLMGF
jgi:hypothetical protein